MHRCAIVLLGIAASAAPFLAAANQMDTVLDRVDKAGAAFKALSAHVRRIAHTAAINEDNEDNGTILLKRVHSRDVRMLIEVSDPDARTVAFQGHKLEVYYPKIQTVQEFDVGKSRDLLEQFFLLGFGTSRADLLNSYNLRLLGQETVADAKTERIEMIPKSKEVLQYLTKVELWVAGSGYPVQQKFFLKGGDYQLATYSDVKINPELQDAALKLHLPKNVKREFPQK
ncbi:MAG TPA: hypothetical protein VMT86_01665 [Bryobacteraceae bacterium]|nr:hypothetical protein [Bryobacteraceae bacterium]